jgi:hypothetical protein
LNVLKKINFNSIKNEKLCKPFTIQILSMIAGQEFGHSKQVLKLNKVVSQAHLWVSIENVGYFENDILNHKSHGVCSDRF